MAFKDVTHLAFIIFFLMELFIGVLWRLIMCCDSVRNSNRLRN